MRQLIRRAAEQGLRVHGKHLPPGKLGFYSPLEARIYFSLRLTESERRSVIAHELGHAHYGHLCDGTRRDRHESQADIYAARLLIDPAAYAELERVNPDQHHLAEEFNVTVDVIYTYEAHCLTRLRGITYSSPRMGIGQWAHRSLLPA
ncbi:ImmA/IrrE family metallo-endopeptidase [Microbacterium hydrocarbonoxydans]|uniref:ImmA/IrrE family metallo-endopeptidase n=1 Tax=Microbacterium hydrocarbonoxydans TaxID=273678 RepID=UPI003D95B7ED